MNAEGSEEQIYDKIPRGRKENVQYILNNRNLSRYQRGLSFIYPRDDAGMWISASKIIVFRLHEDSTLSKVPNSAYKFDLPTKLIFNVQTNEAIASEEMNHLVVVKKLYGTLKGNKSYQRRLTYFLEVPENLNILRNYCFVEYGSL